MYRTYMLEPTKCKLKKLRKELIAQSQDIIALTSSTYVNG